MRREPEARQLQRVWITSLALVWMGTLGIAASEASASTSVAGDSNDGWVGDASPLGEADWTPLRAAHLLERAGFGGTPAEVQQLASMSPAEAVAHLVHYERIPDSLPPFEHSGIWGPAMHPDVDLHMRFDNVMAKAAREGVVYGEAIRAQGPRPLQDIVDALYYKYLSSNLEWQRVAVWWAERMLRTQRPLEEKMTLFWHGHFATEELKVDDYRLMLRQNETLRSLATSNMRDLLVSMSKDPAMLLYLDNRLNVKGQANENYAREILELFSLGIGNYTERDIKEAARAFTGWRNQGLQFVDDREQHDSGEKTIFGKTGSWGGEDVVDLILEQEACARFLTAKIYRFFVREDLPEALHARLARTLRANSYELTPLLEEIFLSRDFYSSASVGTQIKSPVHYLVSTYRKLGLERIPGTPYFPAATQLLGQSLGNPPNVKGWDGGRAWLNPSTVLTRNNLVGHLLFPETALGKYPQYPVSARIRNAPREAEQRDRAESAGAGAADAPGLETMSQPEAGMRNADSASEGSANENSAMKMSGDAPSAKMHNQKAEYDLKLGLYRGLLRSYERVRAIPPTPAPIDLADMLRQAKIGTSAEAVDYFAQRFLRLPLSSIDRQAIVGFLERRMAGAFTLDDDGEGTVEESLRLVLHLILSTPEYQLA